MTCLISSTAASRSLGVFDNQYERSSDFSWRFETTTAERSTFAISTSFMTSFYPIAAISDTRRPSIRPKHLKQNAPNRGHQTSINPTATPRRKFSSEITP